MRKHLERVPDYLDHMLDASNQINGYISGFDIEQFLASRLVQDSVATNIEIVGEASHRILVTDNDFEELRPEIELTRAYWTRNAVIHGCEEVDFTSVWRVATMNEASES